jgi:hypothetical protein
MGLRKARAAEELTSIKAARLPVANSALVTDTKRFGGQSNWPEIQSN